MSMMHLPDLRAIYFVNRKSTPFKNTTTYQLIYTQLEAEKVHWCYGIFPFDGLQTMDCLLVSTSNGWADMVQQVLADDDRGPFHIEIVKDSSSSVGNTWSLGCCARDDWHNIIPYDIKQVRDFVNITCHHLTMLFEQNKRLDQLAVEDKLNWEEWLTSVGLTNGQPYFVILLQRAVYSRVWHFANKPILNRKVYIKGFMFLCFHETVRERARLFFWDVVDPIDMDPFGVLAGGEVRDQPLTSGQQTLMQQYRRFQLTTAREEEVVPQRTRSRGKGKHPPLSHSPPPFPGESIEPPPQTSSNE